ncbi:DUF1295 domain-containing protein [Corticibacterium sp. UT-5YL-CI-8]|nr:DUF1295 domain-containing protein [Tianweitania sp. UT-5YL-CI-8]
MMVAWAIAIRTGRSGWIDAIWSFALGAAGSTAALMPLGGASDLAARQWLVAAMAVLWAMRLGGHILLRTLGGGDDPRYAHLQKEWGDAAPRRLFWFLQIQAAAAFLLTLSIAAAAHNPAPELGLSDLFGVALLLVAVVGEGLADRQLKQFRSNPAHKGEVCDVGLWAISRHPNYFFQWLGWVAYAVIAIEFTGGYPWGWVALAGPAFMYWLLVYASGIPPLEEHMLRSRSDKFRAYQARVNAFWPGPPANRQSQKNTI